MCLIHIGKKKYIESAFLCIGAFVIISASNNDEISFHLLHITYIHYSIWLWYMIYEGEGKSKENGKRKVK